VAWSGLVYFEPVEIKTITEAKAQLSALVERVLAGEEIVIGRAGRPVARLIPYRVDAAPRQPGMLEGQIKIADDFDELPADLAESFGA